MKVRRVFFSTLVAAGLLGGLMAGAVNASTDLHQGTPITGSAYGEQSCSTDELALIGQGEMLWHFVLTQTSAVNTGTLHATFDGAGDTTTPYSKFVGGVLHWNVITASSDVLESAWTDADGGRLNLSHVCSPSHPEGAPLGITKTASGSFTRTYSWNIDKDVDKTLVEQFGGTATFNYTVDAWQTGFTDSAWAVGGTITVTNLNSFDVPATVTDVLPGATCSVTDGVATIPAGSSVDFAYSCLFAAAPATSLTNTASVAWSAVDTLVAGSADYVLDFSFPADPTATVNKTIHVTDTYAGALGTLTATDSAPFATAEFGYARTVNVPTWDCVTYDNTATITETGQNDSISVKVCGPAKTGALTMGFWQNKNGQGIIKAGASSNSVCTSGTWLRTYAPFQDLSASASCAQVASYVYNVIKAANASGSSMNAMLKAQMLATALDVYFSNPALGGNRINAPAPIGGVSVDLTKICTDIGCASFEDASSVFGGSPKTVLAMLTYAASQSNVGGSMWYGNVKATQELAKDAFDAINNQKVFAP